MVTVKSTAITIKSDIVQFISVLNCIAIRGINNMNGTNSSSRVNLLL